MKVRSTIHSFPIQFNESVRCENVNVFLESKFNYKLLCNYLKCVHNNQSSITRETITVKMMS